MGRSRFPTGRSPTETPRCPTGSGGASPSAQPRTMRASQYENVVDFEHEQSSAWKTFDGAPGPFHDSTRARVSLLSTATIGEWSPRRFRPNVLLDGAREDSLIGSTV